MSGEGAVIVVGGSRSIGLELAKHYAAAGRDVVLTGRDQFSVSSGVAAVQGATAGARISGLTFDLANPHGIAAALGSVGPVGRLALVAIDRDANAVADYDIDRAIRLVTLKLIGYTAVVSALRGRFTDGASVVLFGGMAKERPYPGSTTVSTVNGGVTGLTRSLVEELRPIRVNAIHPGVVGDSPYWVDKPAAIAANTAVTPLGRLATMSEIVDATVFLLENGAVNGVDLIVDGGRHCR